MAQRLAKGVKKSKSTPICPFLFHLYEGQRLLTEDEELDYWTAKEMPDIGSHRIRIQGPEATTKEQRQLQQPRLSRRRLCKPQTRGGRPPTEHQRVTSSSVKRAFELGSTGATIAGSTGTATHIAIGSSTGSNAIGRKPGMGGEALRRSDCKPPAGKEAVPGNGGGA